MMPRWTAMVLLLLTFCFHAQAQTQSPQLSVCVTDCLTSEFPVSGCSSPADIQCICASVTYTNAVGACLQANCTSRDALAAQRYSAETCNKPIRNEGDMTRKATWATFTLAICFLVGRFLFHNPYLSGAGYGADDWTVLLGFFLLIPIDALVENMIRKGLGQDIYMVQPDHISEILYNFWVAELLYVWLMGATKCSILLLYLRIWQRQEAGLNVFRLCCWILIGVMVAFVAVFSIVLGFNCTPISYLWNQWDNTETGHCLDTFALINALAATNVALDFIICLLPIPKCLKLSVSLRKKLGICFLFLVGLFVTICSIIRFSYLVQFGKSSNPTWDYNPIALWSSLEANLSVVCVCLPSMAGLFQRAWKHGVDGYGSGRGSSNNRSLPRHLDEVRLSEIGSPHVAKYDLERVREKTRSPFDSKRASHSIPSW